MLAEYYRLTKPGIVYGNVLTTLAAFLYASRWEFSLGLFFATMAGMMLVIAGACVFNNYLDREIDKKMERTKGRALATGRISGGSALGYGSVLVFVGLALLLFFVNALAAALALFGFLMYVVAYGYAKRAASWGTIVGSLPGAVPIVVGYVAVTGRLDLTALILFLILVVWQMPHFYAIALYRRDEYAAAGIPVLPIEKGARRTKRSIIAYLAAFIITTALLFGRGAAGYVYLAIVLGTGFAWLISAVVKWHDSDERFGRSVFLFSLIALLAFCTALAVAPLLP